MKHFAAIVIAVTSVAAPLAAHAVTTITSPFRGVTHITRDEPAGAVAPRKVVMHILEIDLTDPSLSFLATPGNGDLPGEFNGQTTSQFAAQYGLQAAINGDFYSSAGSSGGVIYRNVTNLATSNGQLISPWPTGTGTARGAINITADNDAKVIRPTSGAGDTYNHTPVTSLYNTVGGSSRLLNNGNIIVGTSGLETEIHPRTVVGVKPGAIYFFTVDGRQPGYSEGMNLTEIATLLRDQYGVKEAVNLDGGGSTTMVMADPTLRVINKPSDGSLRTNGNNLGLRAAIWQDWKTNGNGNWSTSSNWTNGIANSVGAAARFGGAITAARTVTVNSNVTAGTITFDSAHTYTIGGTSLITLDVPAREAAIEVKSASLQRLSAPMELRDKTEIDVAAGGTLEMNGQLANPLAQIITKLGSGGLMLSGAQSHANGTTFHMNAGALTLGSNLGTSTSATVSLRLNGGATTIASPQNLAALNTVVAAAAGVSPGGANTIKTASLSIATGAAIDLTDNALALDYTGTSQLGAWNGSSYSGVTAMLAKSQLRSSSAAASAGQMTLGVAEAAKVLRISGSQTASWKGQIVDATSVLVMYTRAGDANLSSGVDADDYFQIDSHYNRTDNTSKSFFNGDFNYDGVINADDYAIIDAGYSGQSLSSAGVTSVPEPAGVALVTVAAALMRRRRRPL